MEDRYEAAREVMRQLDVGPEWRSVTDPDMPAALLELTAGLIDAYRRGDLEWVLEHTDPEIEIVQVPETPDAKTYRGHEGLIDALLDWPLQWGDFRIEARRIFAFGPDDLLMTTLHKGRPQSMDIEVEAEITFVMHWRDGRATRWDMFLTVDEALRRAAESSAHRDDYHAAQRDRRKRAQEAGPEEARTDHR
jgi:ketosteroid isomerase-like protein